MPIMNDSSENHSGKMEELEGSDMIGDIVFSVLVYIV